jgi:hypothetical protein
MFIVEAFVFKQALKEKGSRPSFRILERGSSQNLHPVHFSGLLP